MSPAPLADADQTLARTLLRLARPGAYAHPSDDASGSYHVFSARNAFAGPVATLSDAAIGQAQALGWLACPSVDGRLSLSRQGRRAIKRALTCAGTPAASPASPSHGAAASRMRSHAAPPRTPGRVEGPLLWLRNRKDRQGQPLITQAQYEAGTRFATDYGKGQMLARVTASWSVTAPCLRTGTPGAGVDMGDAALAARDRIHAALAAVGPEMGQLLVDVCCHDIGLEAAERARRWPVRSGKVVLDMGLTALARHYGYDSPANDAASSARRRPASRRWSDPDFRPTLSHWEAATAPAANRDAAATTSP